LRSIKEEIVKFLEYGLVVSPWLAGIGNESRFDDDIFEYLDGQAQSISEMLWTEAMQTETFGEDIPVPDRIPRTALYEIVASTAVWIAHEETGTAEVTFNFAEQALQRVRTFIQEYGLTTLVEVYVAATRYENYQAIWYYEEMPEREFILGHLHRPWVDYSLQDELILSVLTGNFKLKLSGDRRVVTLTEKGLANFMEMEIMLEEIGYLNLRCHHLQLSRFNMFDGYQAAVHKIAPNWIPQRVEFLDFLGIEPGMRVLEIGCGDGLFTFEGGLAQRIGSEGKLIGIDPSKGMLNRVQKKWKDTYPWVSFLQGRVEQLPFEDETFDAVVGVAFLHLTDIPIALREMKRVTRKGGIVGSFHMFSIGMDAPFFVDWLAPLMNLAKKNKREEPKTYLTSKSDMEKYFAESGLLVDVLRDVTTRTLYWWPEENIDILIRRFGWAQEELSTIPWKAREVMIKKLQERGLEIAEKYAQEMRIIEVPMQMVRCIIR